MDNAEAPSEVRETILGQHEELRTWLLRVDKLAERVALGETEAIDELRADGRELLERFERHLGYEDQHLVPVLRDIDAWGEERARRVDSEHRDQRVLLNIVLNGLDAPGRDAVDLAHQLRGFVATVRDDMLEEERFVLSADLLRDDVVAISLETG